MDDNDILNTLREFDDASQPKRPLPNAQTSLILGILSIVLCWCCVSFILAVIGLVLALNAENEYKANPNLYSEADYKNATLGKILSIISIPLSIIVSIASFFLNIFTDIISSM